MNIEDVEKILAERIIWVDFRAKLKAPACLEGLGDQFIIALREGDLPEEHKKGLIHEVAHIHFGSINPLYLSTFLEELSDEEFLEMEEFIEQQTTKFCAINPDYVKEIYERYQNL